MDIVINCLTRLSIIILHYFNHSISLMLYPLQIRRRCNRQLNNTISTTGINRNIRTINRTIWIFEWIWYIGSLYRRHIISGQIKADIGSILRGLMTLYFRDFPLFRKQAKHNPRIVKSRQMGRFYNEKGARYSVHLHEYKSKKSEAYAAFSMVTL